MRDRIRDGAAITIVGLCLALSVPALLAPPMAFTGITLRVEGDAVVVATVDPASRMLQFVQPGMVISEIDYTPISGIAPKSMDAYLRGDFVELGWSVAGGTTQIPIKTPLPQPDAFDFLAGVGVLLGIAVWVGRGEGGETLRPLAIPLAVASAAPLILDPTWVLVTWPAVALTLALLPVAQLPLADGLVERVAERRRRVAAGAGSVLAAIGFVALGLGALAAGPNVADSAAAVRGPVTIALYAAILLVPAAMLLRSRRREPVASDPSTPGRSTDRLPILLAALTPPVIGLAHGYDYLGIGLSVPVIWLLVVVVVLQANSRFETLRLQRDAVVAATEAERSRLAADLHDDALQEITVLVRRLDDTGDARSASLARSIADRLREVCGELRLPILDELGAGPALEWLVARVAETSGRPVELVRDDTGRPPADVELAIFRVAQEALANAVTHGAPPIVVRYAAASDRASLSVTDEGLGLAVEAAAAARRSGHYGLLNMRQRAEQIGATIDMRRPTDGGTAISLNWSAS